MACKVDGFGKPPYGALFSGKPGAVQLVSPADSSSAEAEQLIFSLTRVGVEPTKSPRPQHDRFACLRTWSIDRFQIYQWRVRELHPAVPAYEARMSTGSPALKTSNIISPFLHALLMLIKLQSGGIAGPGTEPGRSSL